MRVRLVSITYGAETVRSQFPSLRQLRPPIMSPRRIPIAECPRNRAAFPRKLLTSVGSVGCILGLQVPLFSKAVDSTELVRRL